MSRVPLVTVSIPAWRCSDTIRETVLSVLNQTVSDLTVIVTNDGDDPDLLDCLSDLSDPRLQLRRSARNIGRYAVDHGIAQGCRSRWMAICDADDWVEPTWIESMLACANDADVVVAPHVVHDLQGRAGVYDVQPFTESFSYMAHMGACLWSADWLRDAGATTPHVRVGWDNVMVGLAFLRGRVSLCDEPTYHRIYRYDSLTTSSETGMRSPMRAETARLLRDIWADLVESPSCSSEITASLNYDRRIMLSHASLPTTDWSMTPAALIELEAYLFRAQPRQILEMGSGLSTVVLANYARITGASVTTLEHDARYFRQTQLTLHDRQLRNSVNLVPASLSGTPPTYDYPLPQNVDFLVIDGPPERLGGRAATLPHALPDLAERWTAWLDDGDRPGEQAAVAQWRGDHRVYARQTEIPRGVTLVSDRQMKRSQINASSLVLCLLTGWRAPLLEQTLRGIPTSILRSAHLIVCHDGADPDSEQVLDRYSRYIDTLHTKRHTDRKMDTIGRNWSDLMLEAADLGEYVMMLEDDWLYITEDPSWLQTCIDALSDPDVYQVRLRHLSDQVRDRHMISGQRIAWASHQCGLIADAHLTFNPSVMRSADIRRVFPSDGEIHAQRQAHSQQMRCVVQLVPGVFTHIGSDDSMRQQLSPPA